MNRWLLTAGILDAVAALLHFGCVIGGPAWYRFLGAGEHLARMAERGMWRPAIFALAIGAVVSGWAIYSFSGAGVIPRLPLLRPVLFAIAAVYLARAAMLPWLLRVMADRGATFLWVTSAIVLVYGAIHLIGALTLRAD